MIGETCVATVLILVAAVILAIMFFLAGWRSGRGMW